MQLTGVGAPILLENAAGGARVLIAPNAAFTAPGRTFGGATIRVSGLIAGEDVMELQTSTTPRSLRVMGGQVLLDNVAVGTAAQAGGTFTITFNAGATAVTDAVIDQVIDNLTFRNTSATPTLIRTVTLNVIDAAGQSVSTGNPNFVQRTGAGTPLAGLEPGAEWASFAAADVDGDGDLDVIANFIDFDTVTTQWRALVNTAGAFTNTAFTAIPTDGLLHAAAVDIDRDGDTDLFASYADGERVYVRGPGGFTLAAVNPIAGLDTIEVRAAAFADIDRDGDVDAIVSTSADYYRVLENVGGVIAVRAGDQTDGITVPPRYQRAAVALIDRDADRLPELIVSGLLLAGGLERTDWNSARNFGLTSFDGTGGYAAIDVDRDGDDDLIGFQPGVGIIYFENAQVKGQTIRIRAVAGSALPPPTDGDDVVTGTPFDDAYDGGAGNDLISGLGDADTLRGGAGNDVLDGGDGADVLEGGDGDDTLIGGPDSDTLRGGPGNDTIYADGPNVFGGPGGLIDGGDGDDFVYTRESDGVAGGAGFDAIFLDFSARAFRSSGYNLSLFLSDSASRTLSVGGQSTSVTGFERIAGAIGSSSDDTLSTTSNAGFGVTFDGLAGNDRISGTSFADILRGGDGNDELFGGNGNDTLEGGGGNDELAGGDGADVLDGGEGDDVLDGGAGPDVLRGGPGSETYTLNDEDAIVELAGDPGLDTLRGTLAVFTLPTGIERYAYIGPAGVPMVLTGNAGNNILTGGSAGNLFLLQQGGVDRAGGGAGDDVFYLGANFGVANTGTNNLAGGAGTDRLVLQGDFTGARALEIDSIFASGLEIIELLSAGDARYVPAVGGAFSYRFVDVFGEGIFLTGALTFDGRGLAAAESMRIDVSRDSATRFTLLGGAGADQLIGGMLNDTLDGGAGADLLDASAGGADSVIGGDGNDGVFFGAAFGAGDLVDGGSGLNDQLGLRGNYGAGLTLGAAQLTGVEVVALLPGEGAAYAITTTDDLIAPGATQTFYAAEVAGAFTLNGAAETNGAFRIYGGLGADVITTGGGDDGIFFGQGRFNPATDRVNGGAGNDLLALDGSYTLTLSGAAVQNIEVVALLDGRVGIDNAYSVTLADSLLTGAQALTVRATGVRAGVRVDGAAEATGALTLLGGVGSDTLIGGGGPDRLSGGAGGDTLTGGGGADRFVFAAAPAAGTADTLTDFSRGQGDLLELAFSAFPGLIAGGLPANAFRAAPGAVAGTAPEHRIIYDTVSGALRFDPDGDGGAPAVQFATLAGAPALANTDFLIIA